jgi:tellurite resistance protein TerC
MLALTEITSWHWVSFVCAILFALALDLRVFHKRAHVVQFKEALFWTLIWFAIAVLFAVCLIPWRGVEESLEFVTGYLIELSLSMDNVFVIALIFAYFGVPLSLQHRVLFWGILGALIMRGVMIGIGAALIREFHWMLYVMGGFLLLTGVKMIFASEEPVQPEKNLVLRAARKLFPISTNYEGEKFVTRLNGRRALTPLALVLLMVETTDLVFAVDSIPAIFAITTKAFIIFTSNVFAILGLRSLYFVLANAIGYFRYLKVGLSIVLVFIGGKMLLAPSPGLETQPWFRFEIPTHISLAVVGGIIVLSIVFSIVAAKRSDSSPKT